MYLILLLQHPSKFQILQQVLFISTNCSYDLNFNLLFHVKFETSSQTCPVIYTF